MSWSLHRWIWRLEAPVHVGLSPAGSINRCRLYVPARVLWGALTAELARSQNEDIPKYQEVGATLRKQTRLGYLFPAEQVDGEWRAWLPRYEMGKGLVWRREAPQAELDDRQFRMRLLSTRPGTAIEPGTDTAEEGSLRETELVNPNWRDVAARDAGVALVGYVFLSSAVPATDGKGELLPGKPVPEVLWLGGDARYGLGKVRRVSCEAASDFFGYRVVCATREDPVVLTDCLLAHGEVSEDAAAFLLGQQEMLAGWDHGKLQTARTLFWQPGSSSAQEAEWRIGEQGHWRVNQNDGGQTQPRDDLRSAGGGLG